ncbi:hypothetical protein [Jannaschia sp. W003]|uniref:hypothetical protein n=1 Tax=Jannaschia sp. W003 TaxID=2867012 RepID=UPI0021A34F6C|nr:hypothetical protein [Jannaschia sp. W003]UWQ21392.1 hypothetical protein K3554_15700 [Jannaschia sp. W003]
MRPDSETHVRRRGRNFGVLAALVGFILVVFAVTVVKVREGGLSEGFDHVMRPQMLPLPEDTE